MNEAVLSQVEALCNCALPLCVGVISTCSTVLKAKWTKSVHAKVFAYIQCLCGPGRLLTNTVQMSLSQLAGSSFDWVAALWTISHFKRDFKVDLQYS